jgi:hypothetical protein
MGDVPSPGDTVVVSRIDQPLFIRKWNRKQVTERESYPIGGRVMDMQSGAGFFSDGWGFLPWTWSTRETNVFEVWKIE